ncbi:MAG: O-antigen ligase family protein [Hyphomonadaceae bacterium]|nr:O-antigen ligase family protein [Hyphomonadaceae bacterium]
MSIDHQYSPTWVERKDNIVLILVFLLLPIMAQAGGLGIAAIASIGGGLTLIGLGPSKIISIVKSAPNAFWVLMLLLVYGLVSSFWSPYQSTRSLPNPMILVLGVPLYFLCARAVIRQSGSSAKWLRRVWIWGTIASAIAILIDLTTGYAISLAVDPVSPGESFESRRGDVIQNLGHGVAVLTLLFPPVATALWQAGAKGRAASIVLAAIILATGFFAGMSASMLALCLALVFMAFVLLKPKIAVGTVHILAGLSLLTAPFIAFLSSRLSNAQLAALPFSWEERIHNWRYIYHKILEHPIVGHGFDAVRTFEDKHSIRGFDDRAIVSLHPHNAGLHIWVELGLIGISISVLAIYLSYKTMRRISERNKFFAIAICGTGAAALTNASLTFGVWQDWWWASIILAFSVIALIPYTTENI